MRTIVEIHALQNFAPSNLNRDDTGAPKDAMFGGVRRARISSQCGKRAIRRHFAQKQVDGFFSADELAVRTKRVYDAIAEALEARRARQDALKKAEVALSSVDLRAAESGKSQYLLFLGRREIAALAAIIDQEWDSIDVSESVPAEKAKGKAKNGAPANGTKELRDRVLAVFDGGKSVDVGLFGRMLADMPQKNQIAACQVAHAISTHAVDREFDFYTAVDDLKAHDTSGADMMGTIEFTSACFYRYAVVDWEKLIENLQGDTELAKRGLRAFLEGFVIAEPTGKQSTFAAHNPPEFVAVCVRNNTAPRSFANAFEVPVWAGKEQSLTAASALRLVSKARGLQAAYGGAGQTFALNIAGIPTEGFASTVASLEELLSKSAGAIGA